MNTHVSRTVHRLIAARLWLTVYQLPPYAPKLNSVEGVWSHLKRSLANLTEHNLDQLTAQVKTRLKRVQYQRGPTEGLMAKKDSTSNRRDPSS
ncbi:transposase [Streptomyces sp. NPDC002922]|uniref:transposase n=1 Tax=Streptomyces sp. NPDC002922 TaxID=3154439 RepID=UPI0033A6FADE